MIKHQNFRNIMKFSLAFSMLCFREIDIVDEISKKYFKKKNNNRKNFLGASHCIYLKF